MWKLLLFSALWQTVTYENSAALMNVIEYDPRYVTWTVCRMTEKCAQQKRDFVKCMLYVSQAWLCLLLFHDVRYTLHWGCGISYLVCSMKVMIYFLIVPVWWLGHHLFPACSSDLFARLREQGILLYVKQNNHLVYEHRHRVISLPLCIVGMEN